jgi:hypothetical protein
MSAVFIWWGIWAALLLLFAGYLGTKVNVNPNAPGGGLYGKWYGILVDSRHRFSLTHFQIVVWTIIILSLIFGVFTAKAFGKVSDPLNFEIPSELLILMGISATSTVLSSTIKSQKNGRVTTRSLAMGEDDYQPKFYQMFMVEEGNPEDIDKLIDPTKFQNFLITFLLAIAFVVSALNSFGDLEYELQKAAKELGETLSKREIFEAITALPGISDNNTLLTLLGISHAGYITGKIPDK